jgi:hypothetical protein
MSKAIDIADAMAARLNALTTLPGVEAIVWRQKDFTNELAQKTSRVGGALIVILYSGFANSSDAAAVHLNVARRYTVSIFAKPVIRTTRDLAADDIVETVAATLHNWEPDETLTGAAEIKVSGCELRPDTQYLIYDLDLEVLSRL